MESKQSEWLNSPSTNATVTFIKALRLTASLELEVEDVEEGDTGEGEGEECREGDGEDEFDEVLLLGADCRTTTSLSSSTLLLHSSSC